MLELVILREHFAEILRAAEAAAAECDRLVGTARDPTARERFERLARDHRRGVELTERLLEIVSE